MRISSDPRDPFYHPSFSFCRVFLEGAERNNVVTADEEARYAKTYRLDEFGNPKADKNGFALYDEFRGSVRVDCSDWLREAMKPQPPEEEPDTLSAAILGMIQTP